MKNRAIRAMDIFLFLVLVFCGTLQAQDANSNRAGYDDPAAAVMSASVQLEGPAKGTKVDATYIIGNDDVLSIYVWKEPDLSKDVTVRTDGRISLPLVGELQATGRTPPELELDIAARLKSYITDPEVTVIVKEIKSKNFNILGQVNKPGSFPLTSGMTIIDAIATAGGFRDFAKRKSIYVLRENSVGGHSRIPFNYEKFIKGKSPSQNIQLMPHDTIVVP
jgi:polysaccharide biosynthesis/export protein